MDKLTPKEFALKAIGPYYKDPSLCGSELKNGKIKCCYRTAEGKRCVAGRFLSEEAFQLKPIKENDSISDAIKACEGNDAQLFVEEARGVLTRMQWISLQIMHDCIAEKGRDDQLFTGTMTELGLFTLGDLDEYIKTI